MLRTLSPLARVHRASLLTFGVLATGAASAAPPAPTPAGNMPPAAPDRAAPSRATASTPAEPASASEAGAAAPAEGAATAPVDASGLSAADVERIARELAREQERRAAWRQETESSELPTRAEVIGLTVAGGVSLGSYEAGQVYLLTEALKASPGSARLMIATGASAGNVNALLAATEACGLKPTAPTESLGYRVWVDVGLDQLFDPERVTSRSLFMQDVMTERYQLLRERWTSELSPSCEFVFGLSITRQRGLEIELAEDLVVPRQAERITVHVKGREGMAPAFRNFLDPAHNFERPLLPLSDGEDPTAGRDAAALEPAVLASAAFPVAFPAVSIPHCITDRRATLEQREEPLAAPTCPVATRADKFVDGGVFDNNPLGITLRIARRGLVRGPSGATFRTVPTPEADPAQVPEPIFAYVDPDLRRYPLYTPPSEAGASEEDPLLGILANLGGEALASARGQELARIAESDPHALRRLWLIKGNYPPMSELLGAFFGFFERDLRDFDFHLGSYDTYHALRDETASILGTEPFIAGMKARLAVEPAAVSDDLVPFACMMSKFEPELYGRLAPVCARTSRNFRVLLQTTILRLWSNCRRLGPDETAGRGHLACTKAQGGLPAPRVDASFPDLEELMAKRGESDLDHVLRVLSALDFHYRDLGLKPDQASRGRLTIRRKLDEMVTALANAQPGFAERTLVLTGGRTLVNGIEYEPPASRWYVLVGSSLDVGHLGKLGRGRAWYWNADARISALQSLVTDRPNLFAGTLSAGVEFALLGLSGNIMQTSLGLRGGYYANLEDAAGFDPCLSESTGGDTRLCSQPVIHVPLNLTLLERVRFTLTPIFLPMPQDWGHDWFDLEFGLGAELF